MKKKLALAICMMTISILSISSSVSAHEFMKPLRWSITSGSLYKTQVCHYLLNSNSFYQDNFSTAVYNWATSPTPAYCVETTFSISNVDFVTPTQAFWDSLGLSQYALALTSLTDTNGYSFDTNPDSQNSTGFIRYAAIYVNPNNNSYSMTDIQQTSVMVHEIGHVYGLWHCSQSTNSIMRPGIDSDSPSKLQTHDTVDMNNYY